MAQHHGRGNIRRALAAVINMYVGAADARRLIADQYLMGAGSGKFHFPHFKFPFAQKK